MNLPVGLPLFDAVASADARDAGIGLAASPAGRQFWLRDAKETARKLARRKGEISADDVVEFYAENDVDLTGVLGNAMGGLFRGAEWEWTGKYIKSARVHAHSNLLRVWRIRLGGGKESA